MESRSATTQTGICMLGRKLFLWQRSQLAQHCIVYLTGGGAVNCIQPGRIQARENMGWHHLVNRFNNIDVAGDSSYYSSFLLVFSVVASLVFLLRGFKENSVYMAVS